MSQGLYSHTTRSTGTILTAAIYNSDHQNHITNQNPTMTGALSDNLSQHQSVQDPGGLGTEVLAANLAEELQQLRFAVRRITGKAQWYIAPATDLESVGGAITDLQVSETVSITGDLTPAQITANQNNYAPTGHADAFNFRLSADALRVITGLAGGAAGRMVVLQNVGTTNLIQLSHEDGASTAANRFALGTEGTVDLGPGNGIIFRYDTTSSRWRPLTTADMSSPGFHIPFANAFDFPEFPGVTNPGANIARMYSKDVSGITKMAFRDSAGTETVIGPQQPARAYAEYTANAALSTTIPRDDTIPQNTEGTEIVTATITPASASNRVRVSFTGFVHNGDENTTVTAIAALFRDSIANALHATSVTVVNAITVFINSVDSRSDFFQDLAILSFVFEHSPATTSPTTYKVRVGPHQGDPVFMNGLSSGRLFGGVAAATLTLQEIII